MTDGGASQIHYEMTMLHYKWHMVLGKGDSVSHLQALGLWNAEREAWVHGA